MQTLGSARFARWRCGTLLMVLVVVEVAIIRAMGSLGVQVEVLGRLGDPSGDPVAGLLAVLAAAAELLAVYLLIVLALHLASWLPGVSGRFATRGARLVTLPFVRRAIDGLLGGVLLAQMVVAPVAVRAEPVPGSDLPPVVAASALAGGSRVADASGAAGPELQPGAAGRSRTRTGQVPGTTGQADGAAVRPPTTGGQVPGTTGQAHGAAVRPPTTGGQVPGTAGQVQGTARGAGSTVPPPTWVPLPTWLGGSQVPGTSPPGSTMAGPMCTQPPSPWTSAGHGADASAEAGGAGVVEPGVTQVHVIRPGDSLWAVAEAQLPPSHRSPSRIDRCWRQIYAANRAVLGDDPDLIHPGARLVLPPFPPKRTGGR